MSNILELNVAYFNRNQGYIQNAGVHLHHSLHTQCDLRENVNIYCEITKTHTDTDKNNHI